MEETTTSTSADDSASTTEQAEETTEQAVDTSATQDTDQQTEQATEQDASEDDELKAWAEKKGLSLDDPIALAKMVREGDKKVTEATQAAKKLESSIKTASADLDDVQQLRNEVAVMNFFQSYPDARELESEMAKVVEEKPYFANDLEGLYFYTKGLQADRGLVAAKQAGSKETLAAVAQKERAAAPKASASTRTETIELTNEDIKNMSLEEYQTAKAEGKINPFR